MRRRTLVACGVLAASLTACGDAQTAADQTALSTTASPPATSSSTSQAGTAAGTPPPPPSSAAPPAATDPGRCSAAVLDGRVEPTDAGAGNRYGKLLVTNTGAGPCTLNGYSGLQLLAADGSQVPTQLERTADPGPSAVTLPPGGTAVANLHWTVVATGDEPVDRPCEPEAPSAAAVPPDETEPMRLNWGLGPVCGGGKIYISAFYAA
ncbi:DUF4232 domain-containing protein [Saccharothrix coeruleofusca]|uniref:DUF4232 domain-containing protein n=1 Tax=Saccharothrix coeruleofusca TaxID=33919 RepID=UPI00166F8296|nr:DUF4232 domain-containing protein [Saccharothrix coeruleofusca]